ncbi:MAG: AmmeMemoRadiSam system radical SAM enzyme [Marinifilaceae bacterium]
MEKAQYFETLQDKRVNCTLCPHQCTIPEGHRGICLVRINREGVLYTEVKEKYSAIHMDPIEKKPLYHFFPGSSVLSLGTKGCNLKCKFCQNHEISQCLPGDFPQMSNISDEQILNMTGNNGNCIGIAYTYNEPTVFFETMISLARKVKEKGMQNVMVTNGYINAEPLNELLEYIDAFNVDLKSFSDYFYKQYTYSKLAPVLESLKAIRLSGKHLEVTNLVIPGLNSDASQFEEMVRWIAGELGPDTVLHISRYFPAYQVVIDPTPVELLHQFFEIAKQHLSYVYLGNVDTHFGNSTSCKHCGNELVRRLQYRTEVVGMENGRCVECKHQILPVECVNINKTDPS